MYKGVDKRKSWRLIFQDTVLTSQENTCSGRKYSTSILFARQPQSPLEIVCIFKKDLERKINTQFIQTYLLRTRTIMLSTVGVRAMRP